MAEGWRPDAQINVRDLRKKCGEAIARDYLAGRTLTELAKHWGGSSSLMHSILAEMGVPRRRRGYKDPSERSLLRKEFADAVAGGENVNALAMEWGISRTAGYSWCRTHGVQSGARQLAQERSKRAAEAVRRMVAEGLSLQEAADRAAVSKATARRAIRSKTPSSSGSGKQG